MTFTSELEDNILRFWLERMPDETHGGYYGKTDGQNRLIPEANKGLILTARLLWTFSSAYRILKKEACLQAAHRAFDYLVSRFYDTENKGFYWELDFRGNVVNAKKQTYAQGFAIYGLSEYYRVTRNRQALELVKETFEILEAHADKTFGGYFEAFSKDWKPIEDMRLSDKDFNEKKSMNTHLHVLEAYTNLLRVWEDQALKAAHRNLIGVFRNHIIEGDSFQLFFEEDWTLKSEAVSFGHDIEGSWLLYEAALVTGNESLITQVKDLSLKMAEKALEGLLPDGSMAYEKLHGHVDMERHWWVQAEAVVGYMYAWKNSGDARYRLAAEKTWAYIRENMVDTENGEWYWSRLPDGSVNTQEDKAGFWKCPYHNGRMCLEMIAYFGLN